MRTKLLALGAVAVTLTAVLSGCQKDSGSGSGSSGGGTIASHLIMGGPPEFKTRTDGLPGLKKVYGVVFGKYTVTDVGGPVTVNALKRGQVDAADLFTTDPTIQANGFVVLQDDKHLFAAQNIVPIIAKDKATPAVTSIINGVQAKLTTDGISGMLDQVYNDKADPTDVAKKWLADEGLDSTGTSAKGVSLTVGSANFPENEVLAEIYAQALSAQGASISTKLNIGSREKYLPALEQGSLDLFPEYNGTLLSFLDTKSTATTTQEVDAALAKALPKNLEALKSAEAQDSDAIVVTKETADKYSLTSIGDLAKSAG
jgi:glycine betaine/choline ABC-type transport system substrate-binding protein